MTDSAFNSTCDLVSQAEIRNADDLSRDLIQGTFALLVPEPGFEPGRPCGHGILRRESGSREGSPPPSSHTTVRTVPYTAVHETHASLRCSSRKLRSPCPRSIEVGTA